MDQKSDIMVSNGTILYKLGDKKIDVQFHSGLYIIVDDGVMTYYPAKDCFVNSTKDGCVCVTYVGMITHREYNIGFGSLENANFRLLQMLKAEIDWNKRTIGEKLIEDKTKL